MVLRTEYFGMGQNDWKQPTGLWYKIKLTFEIDCGMLSAILDAKILLYVTLLKSTNDHFSYMCIGLKNEYHLLVNVGRTGK